MANSKNIEIYTKSIPTYLGESLTQRIGINEKNEYYYKNQNSPNINGTKFLQGVGLVVGETNKNVFNEYEETKNNIFLIGKKYSNLSGRSKRLSVTYQENKSSYSSFIPYTYSNSDEDVLLINRWFENRKKIILASEGYFLKTGFVLDVSLGNYDDDYLVDVLFINNSDQGVDVIGVDSWEDQKNSRRDVFSVDLIISCGFNVFKYNLNKNNLLKINQDDNSIIRIKEGSTKKLGFKIKAQEFLELNDFLRNNSDQGFKYSLSMNLNVVSPSIIAGKFKYNTEYHDLNKLFK